jgi:hypothetical protein
MTAPNPRRYAFLGALFILTQAASRAILNAFGFALSRPVSAINGVLSIVVAAPAIWRAGAFELHRGPVVQFLGLATALSCTYALAVVASGTLYDLSVDGQYYHQAAIIAMHNGWDPLTQELPPAGENLWIEHYPQGAWSHAAVLYRVMGRIEPAKALNLLLLLASFGVCYDALRWLTGIGRPGRLLFGVFKSTAVRFQEFGLPYRKVPERLDLPCREHVRISHLDAYICKGHCVR